MSNSSSIFKRNCALLVEKMDVEKNKDCPFSNFSALNMQNHFGFVSNFEHVKFVINEKCSKSNMIIQNIMLHL
jgi:hypothetical protein